MLSTNWQHEHKSDQQTFVQMPPKMSLSFRIVPSFDFTSGRQTVKDDEFEF